MSVPAAVPTLLVRPLVESRPPAVSFGPPPGWLVPPDQPTLDLLEPELVDLAPPRPSASRITVCRARWTARPRPSLPDAGEWGGAFVVAVVQTLLGQRPVAQLDRWLADDVRAAVGHRQRRLRSFPARSVDRVGLGSLRVQHPHPEVAELAARVVVGGTATAVALRLDAAGDRWLCTALELDPRVLR